MNYSELDDCDIQSVLGNNSAYFMDGVSAGAKEMIRGDLKNKRKLSMAISRGASDGGENIIPTHLQML